MARKSSKILTDGELRIMEVVWKKRSATVKEVTEALQQTGTVAYNTVQTMLRILEDKGYLEHTKASRSFVYSALIERNLARSTALRLLLSNFYDDSPSSLVVNLLEEEKLDKLDLRQLKDLMDRSE